MWLRPTCVALFLVLWAPCAVAAAPDGDGYIEGYAAAVLQREFSLAAPSLRVQYGVITLDAADLATVDQASVVAQLERIPGVLRVEVRPAGAPPPVAIPPASPPEPPKVIAEYQVGLLPGNLLFKPLIADPRWPHFSASWQRYVGDPDLKDAGSTTFGESFSLYRGKLGPVWWEVGVQAGVFSVFDLNTESFDLINADYAVGVPLSVRFGDFSAFLRLAHQSSHLGDEFLLRTTRPNRVNVSQQSVDLKMSYELAEILRVYGGGGYLFYTNPSDLKPWSVQYGAELTSPWPSRPSIWRPIAAVDVQQKEENNWSTDVSVRAGIQIEGVLLTRKFQLLFEYFNGHSPNGQFYVDRVEYFGLGAHFHF
jgi:Protein of unknown function (DUF1207)